MHRVKKIRKDVAKLKLIKKLLYITCIIRVFYTNILVTPYNMEYSTKLFSVYYTFFFSLHFNKKMCRLYVEHDIISTITIVVDKEQAFSDGNFNPAFLSFANLPRKRERSIVQDSYDSSKTDQPAKIASEEYPARARVRQ